MPKKTELQMKMSLMQKLFDTGCVTEKQLQGLEMEDILVIPGITVDDIPVFEKLLHDVDDKVRMESPEIFRVLGKRRPEFVRPYVEQLRQISETDENHVVRIHCLGAIKAMGLN